MHVASLVFRGKNGGDTEIPNYGRYRLCSTSEQELEALKDFFLTHNNENIVIMKTQENSQLGMCDTILKLSTWPTEMDENTTNLMLTIRKVLQDKPPKSSKKSPFK